MKYLEILNNNLEEEYCVFLCNLLMGDKKFYKLIVPTKKELTKHIKEGYASYVWGNLKSDRAATMNPFRQNILILLACINNEL
jgi:hypothetical protein